MWDWGEGRDFFSCPSQCVSLHFSVHDVSECFAISIIMRVCDCKIEAGEKEEEGRWVRRAKEEKEEENVQEKYHSFLLNKVTVLSPNIPSHPEVQTVVWLLSSSPPSCPGA